MLKKLGSNSPITPEAGDYLYDNKILVFPDILVNAGG